MHELLGGKFTGPYRASGGRAGHYRLSFAGAAVFRLYEVLRPYLVFKGPQFDKAIGEYDAYQSSRVRQKSGPKHLPER